MTTTPYPIAAITDVFKSEILRTILADTYEHIYLTFIAILIAVGIALPLGIYLTRTRFKRLSSGILSVAGMIQTVPSLALIAFIVVMFALIDTGLTPFAQWLTGKEDVQVLDTIGTTPAIVALVLYALLPILRNTYTGIRQVDPNVIEVARGMGMTPAQVLFWVELPLSLPVIMAGIRISTVWTIGIATLCALVGAGGLGDLIIRGLQVMNLKLLLQGTIPAAILALVFDAVLARLEDWLTPAGLSEAETAS